jgi:hypothetical protein
MQQIEIDFQVFKALTNLRESEHHTYNDVIRSLLGLSESDGRHLIAGIGGALLNSGKGPNGFVASGRFLPHGTILRARYKAAAYHASIKNGAWVNEDGDEFQSASSAARAITQTNVNGLTFWEVKRPSDSDWSKLDSIPKATK